MDTAVLNPRTLAEISGTLVIVGLAGARHMPAPRLDSIYYRWLFDTVQDIAKNNDRIGEVREMPAAALNLHDPPESASPPATVSDAVIPKAIPQVDVAAFFRR